MEALPAPSQLATLLAQYVGLSDNGIAVLDAQNRFLYYNASFSRMFQFGEQSMLGMSHQQMMCWMYTHQRGTIIEWPNLQDWLDYVQSRHRSAPFRSFEIDLKSGRWILMTEQICPGDELVMFCSDITRQKEAEQALVKARDAIERLALTDELTGVPNRRNFMQQLGQELAKAQRHGRPLCLAMLDLDHFKQVNDKLGHAAGDEVLKHFANFVCHHLRQEDVLGRLGGEEFAVLLPETPLDLALSVLRRVVAQLQPQRLPQVAPDFGYTFSAGLVQADAGPHDPDGPSRLLAQADKALYEAKASGRNRVVAGVLD
jgi:diguanylate cyclase (GGDEF)-like protein